MSNNSWSYSKYSTALTCLRKHKYIYVDGLVTPSDENLAFGSALHQALASELTDGSGEAVFEAMWGTESVPKSSRYSHTEFMDMGKGFISKFRRKYLGKIKPILIETRLSAEYKGVPFEGTIDLLAHIEGLGVCLVDHKSAAYNYIPEKIEVALQQNLYAYLAEQNGYKIDNLVYLVFNKGTGSIQNPLVILNDKKVQERMMDDMLLYIKSFDLTNNPKNPNGCIMGKNVCPFFDKCWKGK